MADAPSPISLEEQVRCAERELEKRKKFYPKWVAERGMNQLKADHEIACMAAVVETLKNVKQPLLL
jgi:aconitase B